MRVTAYGSYPECLDEAHPLELHGPPAPGCGNNTYHAVRRSTGTAAVVANYRMN